MASSSYSASAVASTSTASLVPLIAALEAPDVDRHCRLLGPLSLVIQLCMGAVVLSALLLKRAREQPKRPWRIWLFDVGKQCIGQFFVHGVNVALSSGISHWSGEEGHRTNPCSLYFLNVLLDVTLGVALLWAFLKAFHYLLVERLGRDEFWSGHYGAPPRWQTWGKQLGVYVASITLMKVVVLLIIALVPGVVVAGDWLLAWLPTDDAQVAFVVLVWPLLANAIQFVVVDSLIKGKPLSFSLLHSDDHDAETGEVDSIGHGELDEEDQPKHGSPAFPPVR